MVKFFGTLPEFNRYLGGYCRNKVRYITTKQRKFHNGIFEHCHRRAELQSAHITGFERSKIIENIYIKLYKERLELEEFQEAFIKAHMPIEEYFLFLCHVCHTKYDQAAKVPRTLALSTIAKIKPKIRGGFP